MQTFKQIRKILANIDPAGLIKSGAPQDEYDSEARTIANFLALDGQLSPSIIQRIFEEAGLSISSVKADIIYRRLL